MSKSFSEYQDQNILVIGMGVSGRAAARFLISKGANVTGVDRNETFLNSNDEIAKLRSLGLKTSVDNVKLDLSRFKVIVVSPGIPQSHPYYATALQNKMDVIGEIELACRFINQRCIGISGTNGKTTVTLLVAHVLNKCGIHAQAVGNSGIPLTSVLCNQNSSNEVFVIELSSFQLETMHTPILDVAALLNITPDHLDRYENMEEYAKAKMLLENCLKPGGHLYMEEKCYGLFGHLLKTSKPLLYGYGRNSTVNTDKTSIIFKENIECFLPLQYRGMISHDVENLLAAYALCREFGVSPSQFLEAFETFKKPSHRIEFVKEIEGVKYIDDSKGTNIDAVIRAVESIDGNIILIAGGVDKGSAYTPWIEAFKGRVLCVYAIGQAAPKIKGDLGHILPVEMLNSLDDAVKLAAKAAKPGETVLLSPGCSSFDMFKDYAHRGDEFKRIVNSI